MEHTVVALLVFSVLTSGINVFRQLQNSNSAASGATHFSPKCRRFADRSVDLDDSHRHKTSDGFPTRTAKLSAETTKASGEHNNARVVKGEADALNWLRQKAAMA